MALNATVGSPNANSYVTLEEATAYFADRIHTDLWTEFTNQEGALVTASRMLDWYVTWKGYRSSSEQAMQWPRTNVVRRDGSSVDDTIIPNDVKTAVFELALVSLEEDITDSDPLAGIEQVKAGSLMVKADTDDYGSDTIPEKIWKILADLYTQGGGISVVRLMRA